MDGDTEDVALLGAVEPGSPCMSEGSALSGLIDSSEYCLLSGPWQRKIHVYHAPSGGGEVHRELCRWREASIATDADCYILAAIRQVPKKNPRMKSSFPLLIPKPDGC